MGDVWNKYPDSKPEVTGWYQVTYVSSFPCHPLLIGTDQDLRGNRIKSIRFYDTENGWSNEYTTFPWDDEIVAYNPNRLLLNDNPYEE